MAGGVPPFKLAAGYCTFLCNNLENKLTLQVVPFESRPEGRTHGQTVRPAGPKPAVPLHCGTGSASASGTQPEYRDSDSD